MRLVRQIDFANAERDNSEVRSFSEFADRANIVLLGDPGAGKTHLFRAAAAASCARFITARAFLNTPADKLHGHVLFIDGLDEKRAGRQDRDTVDALVVKLFDVAPPKVRISCRAADWLGDSDLAAMAPFFDQQGGACVLHLDNLSGDEQIGVLAGQRVGTGDAKSFLSEATDRGLGEFLENPQNLIMLWRAVQTGSWPVTRKELFQLSTTLMLQEFNSERARFGSGVFSVSELRPVAGAVCAVRLMSDVDAISLSDGEGVPGSPSYRSLNFYSPEKVLAALCRRIFDVTPEQETVDYTHRTTAEFLAAQFLAFRVREGLPLARIMALIGVDRHPAAELRGLHAWLAVHLPEQCAELIEADPYGVLTYGDAASLDRTSCTILIRALDSLSRTNPWFRSGNWHVRAIGALARPDMVGEFRAILNNTNSGFGVRSVVIDALALGYPLPAMLPDLQTILARQASVYAERLGALNALLRMGEDGQSAIRRSFDTLLGNSDNDLRLRAAILEALYGDPYGQRDILTLIEELYQASSALPAGTLRSLAEIIPESDLATMLDSIAPPPEDYADSEGKSWEPRWFYNRILVRGWSTLDPFEPSRVMEWLRKRLGFKGALGESWTRELRAAMQAKPERLRAIAVEFFNRVTLDENRWLALHEFHKATLFELNTQVLAELSVQAFDTAQPGSDRRLFLYEVALAQCFQLPPSQVEAAFDYLDSCAEDDAALRIARDAALVIVLPAKYFEYRSSNAPQSEENRERQQQDFDRDIEQIRSGDHVGWLRHLAMIYFGLYGDTDQSLLPRRRIAQCLGEERVDAAHETLIASLSRSDLPTFSDVMRLAADHRLYEWWYALIAGLNLRWSTRKDLADLPDDFLKGMLVFDISHPVIEGDPAKRAVHPWRIALVQDRTELARDAYLALARLRLSQAEQVIDGLHELLNDQNFEPYRPKIVIDLLRQFPNADPFRLAELLDAVATLTSMHHEFLQLAAPVVSNANIVGERQRDLWLVTAYTIAPEQFERDVEQRAFVRRELVFDLRDRVNSMLKARAESPLPVPMLEYMARLTGLLFPDANHPAGGWWGNTNVWDGSEHFRVLINLISTSPGGTATDALRRLEADPQLSSYKPHISHALSSQRQRRRDAEYDRPNWPQTIETLSNRAPATVSDLHALVETQLRDLSQHVARANTDIYKLFWNVDAHAKPTNPRPEEVCRDDVITLLRPTLSLLNVMIEPEGHMVADKRADISAAMPGRKILCELKRDYHPDLWTATIEQLERFYAHDPDAKGFGIYVVFWFGAKRPRKIPTPPNGLKPPLSASEMEAMLQSLLPEDKRKRLSSIVIDVSGEV